MSFFNNSHGRFAAKKSTPRKAKLPHVMENCPNRQKELGLEIPEISVKLGGVISTFDDGHWQNDIPGGKKDVASELVRLRMSNEKLESEYNFMKLRSDILIDMVASNKIKMKEMETELKQLRGILAKSPLRFSEG